MSLSAISVIPVQTVSYGARPRGSLRCRVVLPPPAACIALAGAREVVGVGGDRVFAVYDLNGGLVRKFPLPSTHECYVRSVCFARRGRMILVGSEDGTIRLVHIENRMEHSFEGHTADVSSVAATDASFPRFVSGSVDGTCRIWNIESGKCEQTCPCDNAEVCAVAVSREGTMLAAGCMDNVVRLFDIGSGAKLSQCLGHSEGVLSVAFSPTSDLLASASLDGTLRCWVANEFDVSEDGRRLCRCARTVLDGDGMVLSCAFSDDGRWLFGGEDSGTVRVCDAEALLHAWDIAGLVGPAVSLSMVKSVLAITNGADDVALFDLDIHRYDTQVRS